MTKKHHAHENTPETPVEQPETTHPPETDSAAAEIAKWRDAALRAHADMENLKKRVALDLEKNARYAAGSFGKDLLSVSDNLENALKHAGEGDTKNPFIKGMIDGIALTYKQLQDALKKHGIERIAAVGHPFDPEKHHVINQVPSDKPAGTIVTELQPGYTIGGDRVLRESMVIVSNGEKST